MRGIFGGIVLAVFLGGFAHAQSREETLADIRQELSVLHVDVQKLKRELSTTGGAAAPAAGGTTIDRVNAIEAELVRLTGKAEALEGRLNAVVTDGTRRIADLEFRLVELEGGDVSKLGETTTLGGGELPAGGATAPAAGGTATTTPPAGGVELAVGEQADFDAAKTALDAGEHQRAAELFAAFAQTYTGGPLTSEAQYLRGEALTKLNDTQGAARSYLEAFSGAPNGPRAPEALLKLGASLGVLGQTQEACVTLAEVGTRFPGGAPAAEAATAMQALGCS
ncbi:MAG: tol-pal system protein YbgF [Paracoccaceae bacterium]